MTSQQQAEGEYAAPRRFEELTVHRRRQLLTIAAIRSLASVAVLITAYFLLPFTTRLSSGQPIASFAAGVLLVIIVLTAQIFATLRSLYPLPTDRTSVTGC
jgi:zinc transporter ZupT